MLWFGRERTLNINLGGTLSIATIEPPPPIMAHVSATIDGITMRGTAPMAYILPDDKMISVQVSYLDARGHAARVDGAVLWSSSDTTIVAVAVAADDSTKADLVPGANLGQVQVTATADADLGAGVATIVCAMDVTVVAGQAVVGVITPVGDQRPFPDTTKPSWTSRSR